MRLTIPLGIADAELVKFLTGLGPGRLRSPFEAEVIQFTALNNLREKKLIPPIQPIYTQGTLVSNFDIEFHREEIGKDLIKFTLDHTLFGAMGVVFLQPSDERHSDLDYKMPPFPSRKEARNLLNIFLLTRPNLKNSSDRDNQEMLYELESITFEAGSLHARRIKLQRAILEAYLDNIRISLGASVEQSWLTSAQEFIIQLPIGDVAAKVDSFIKTHPVDEELKIKHFVSGPGEVYGVEITHDALGNLWSVTLQALIGNYTKIQYTTPIYQSIGPTDKAAQNSDLNSSLNTLLTSDWARSYFESLAKYLGIDIRKEQSTAQLSDGGEKADQALQHSRGGRPGLIKEELIYRLARAQQAEEIRAKDHQKTWKEIAQEIKWRLGSGKPGVKLLEDARQRLKRLESFDPDGLLQRVREFRRKETKET